MINGHKKLMEIKLPPVIFGTSGLGNLFVALDEEAKMKIMKECGVHVVASPADIGKTMAEALKK